MSHQLLEMKKTVNMKMQRREMKLTKTGMKKRTMRRLMRRSKRMLIMRMKQMMRTKIWRSQTWICCSVQVQFFSIVILIFCCFVLYTVLQSLTGSGYFFAWAPLPAPPPVPIKKGFELFKKKMSTYLLPFWIKIHLFLINCQLIII